MATIAHWLARLMVYPKVYLGALALMLVWHLFLLFSASGANAGRIAVLAALPGLFLIAWAVVSPIGLLRRALHDDSPASGGFRLLLAHFGSTALQLLVFAAVLLFGGLLVVLRGVGVPNLLDLLPIPVIDWFVWLVVRGIAVSLVATALLAAIAQCAYAVSRLTERYGRFLLLWSGLMLTWGVLRALPLLGGWFSWLPHLSFEEFVSVGDGFELQRSYYESGPFAAALILAVALVAAAAWVYGILKDPGKALAHEPRPAAPVTGAGSVRQVLDMKERLLIFVAALSLAFVYDVVANREAVDAGLQEALVRPAIVLDDDLGFFRSAPFVGSQGSLAHPAAGIATFVVRAAGDVRITHSESPEIAIHYALRTYAESQRAAQSYHERVSVGLSRTGDRLELLLQTPPADGAIDARVRYEIAVPRGIQIVLDSRHGSVEAHGVQGRIVATLRQASMRATDVQGDVEVEAVDGDLVLTGIQGNVSIRHTNGRVEAHGIVGRLEVDGEHTSLDTTSVQGDLVARLTRSLAKMYQVAGDVDVDAQMTRVWTDRVHGKTLIRGALSPITLAGPIAPVELVSDRGNVTVHLAPDREWNVRLVARRGEVHASFPEEFRVSSAIENRQRVVTAVKGSGATPFEGEVSGAQLSLEVLSPPQ